MGENGALEDRLNDALTETEELFHTGRHEAARVAALRARRLAVEYGGTVIVLGIDRFVEIVDRRARLPRAHFPDGAARGLTRLSRAPAEVVVSRRPRT